MLLEFEGKRYPYRGLDLTPRQIMKLQISLIDADFTTLRTFDDISRVERELMAMPRNERTEHPEILFYSAVVVFAAMTSAGLAVTMDDLLDNPRLLDSLRWIPEPGDRKPGEVDKGKAHRRSASAGGNQRSGKRRTKTRRLEPTPT